MLRVFFATHDPTTLNRQGNDVGTQYRSAIFPADAEQERVARAVMAEIDERGIWGHKLVTTIEPLTEFYPAEAYHDDYYARNPNAGYCRVIVAPKVAKVRKEFTDRLRRKTA
jgi:peptide-methionine (S)-S-oxide reductase